MPPSLILLPCNISDFLSNWLLKKRGSKVELRVPKRGKLIDLKNLADKNAKIKLEKDFYPSHMLGIYPKQVKYYLKKMWSEKL